MQTALLWHRSKSTTTRIVETSGLASGWAHSTAGTHPGQSRSADVNLRSGGYRLAPGPARAGEVGEAAHPVGGVALTPHPHLVLVQPDQHGDLPVRDSVGGEEHDAGPLRHPARHVLALCPPLEFSSLLIRDA